MAFSLMTLVATTSRFDTDRIQDEPTHVQWFVSAISVVFAVAAFSTIAYFIAEEVFAGTLIEGGLVSHSVLR